jgi:hypothetical protein
MRRSWWLVGLGIAAVIVLLLAPLASPDPDGLERVAEDHGFLAQAQGALYSIMPDYSVPGLDDPTVTTIAAGLVGVLIVFLVVWGIGALLMRRRTRASDHSST